MRRTLKALTLAVAVAGATVAAQSAVPEIAFDTNADLLRTPTDVFVGEVGGVGANSKGMIFVYTRTGHPYATLGDNRTFYRNGSKLFQFDAAGKFVRELGQDVYGFNAAIGLRVDPQDNVWTIDEGASQVVKFDTEGRVALVLGRKPEAINVRPRAAGPGGPGGGPGAGPGGPGGAAANRRPGEGVPGSSFNRPTDVAWDKAGNIYVADGIGANNRIAKFDKEGRFIRHWGSTGSEPGQFNGVKALAIDGPATSTPPMSATSASRCSTPTARSRASSPTSARRWRCASHRAPRSTCTCRTRVIPMEWRMPPSTRCGWTAPLSAGSARPGSGQRSSGWPTRSTAAARRNCSWARGPTGVYRRSR